MLQQLKGHWMRKDRLALNSTWGHGALGPWGHLPSSPGRQDVAGSNCWQQHGVGGRLQAQTQSSLGGFSSWALINPFNFSFWVRFLQAYRHQNKQVIVSVILSSFLSLFLLFLVKRYHLMLGVPDFTVL
jgi:Na+/proline symporter